MLTFHNLYRPLTSRPYLCNESYSEYSPCAALRPYILCFWTKDEPGPQDRHEKKEVLLIPDTCMDIIVSVNHTTQQIGGYLCGIQDQPFMTEETKNKDEISTFAIRFHFWAAHLFLNLNFSDICNGTMELKELEGNWNAVFEPFFYIKTIKERMAWTEAFLMKKLNGLDKNPNLFNTISKMMEIPGRCSVKEMCAYTCVSQRQMERMFLQEIGLPIKKISSLVRYQKIWREMTLSQSFEIQDAVYRYGYTDQPHLLKDFRRFHGVSPEEAKKIAQTNR